MKEEKRREIYHSFLACLVSINITRQSVSAVVSQMSSNFCEIHKTSTSSATRLNLTITTQSEVLSFVIYFVPSITVILFDLTTITSSLSLYHQELDYCNSLYFNLPKTQINRL